ncbi:MAG: hypothetical protein WCF84_19605 [Anaerolineae bacterium]
MVWIGHAAISFGFYYTTRSGKRADGRNLFEPAWPYSGVDWGMDEAIVQLIQTEQIPGAIVVGVWHPPIAGAAICLNG